MLLRLGALLLLASVAYGDSVTQIPYHSTQEKPADMANQPGCYISYLDQVIPYDQVTYSKEGVFKCAMYTCESETQNAYVTSCNTIRDRKKKGCNIIEGDKSANYPTCCDRQVCDDSK